MLPRVSSFEGLCLRLLISGRSFIFLCIYRPPSSSLSSFGKLTDVLEMLVAYGCPVIIGGDLNVHVEDPADNDARTLLDLHTTFNLVQHVTGPTHRQGGTLDLVITYTDCPVLDVHVDLADIISDHSLVTCRLTTDRCPVPTTSRAVRSWRCVDRLALQQAIYSSALGRPSASQSAEELFMLYESELRRLADEFAPERVIHDRRRPLSPWFNADCRSTRHTCRKLERRYRHSKTNVDRQAWIDALHQKHADFEDKKTKYWTSLISRDSANPAKLWQSMSQLLGRQNNNALLQASPHTADTFLKFFGDKVQAVQSGTGQANDWCHPVVVTNLFVALLWCRQ